MQRQVDALLAQASLQRDAHLDETICLLDEEYNLVATGSLCANTLRCIAVNDAHQGEGVTGQLVTALLERQALRSHHHVFLYTKPEGAHFFRDLGFHEIARVPHRLVFMENRCGAFASYLRGLALFFDATKRTAAVVMNANPFTYGHQYLLERASAENDAVHCFVVSEDVSLVPFHARFSLVKAGSAHLPNVSVHPSNSYMISKATFPAYFLKEEKRITQTQAQLDIAIFSQIAEAMGISCRYIGDEPFSIITQIYNDVMSAQLPQHGVECLLISRKENNGAPISASAVRQLIHDGQLEAIKELVPPSTYAYFTSDTGKAVIQAIRAAKQVKHD